jgi:hypothetical protein
MGSSFSFDSKDKYISGIMYSVDNLVVGYFTSSPNKNEYIAVYHKYYFMDEEQEPPVMDIGKSIKFPTGFFLSGVFLSQVADVKSTTGATQYIEYHITNGTQTKIGHVKSKEAFDLETPIYYETEFACGTDYINQFNRDVKFNDIASYTGVCVAGDKTPIPIPLVPVVVPQKASLPPTPAFIYNPEPDGPIGMRGPTGWMGVSGIHGLQGDTGLSGPIGDSGTIGPTGLRGEKGLTGPLGGVGPSGPRGVTGERGDQGPSGVLGPNGVIGDQGPNGYRGQQGQQGPSGLVGPLGDPGIPGLKFGKKKYKNQLNITTAITIILLVYIILWVSSVGAMIGITGGAPTSVRDALHTITGGIINVH